MRRDYEGWLRSEGYDDGTIQTQLYRALRVEQHHGDLDAGYERDRLDSLIVILSYSAEDARTGRPNPSSIPVKGNVRNNLASYKDAVRRYRRFREAHASGGTGGETQVGVAADLPYGPEAPMRASWRRPSRQPSPPREGARTLLDFGLDGRATLAAVIATSQYRTILQAVASLALFSHPRTVRQTGGRALFPSIRNPRRVGQIDLHDGRRVLLDDNKSPKDAFLWANGLSARGRDTQFNHVYPASLDAEAYTALPNLCMTPAFIAKLTDTSEEIRDLLRFRSFQLYGWMPTGYAPPARPEEYEALEWAAPLPPVEDVRGAVLAAMATKPRDRTVMAARELGWLFA